MNIPSIKQTKKVLILADDSCNWKVGGLRQLDRILLNVNEAFNKNRDVSLKIFVFWKSGEKRECGFAHPLLESCSLFTGDDTDELLKWLHLDGENVFLVKTNLLIGRGSFNITPFPYTVIIDGSELPDSTEALKGTLWEYFSGLIDGSQTQEFAEETGFYELLKSRSDIDAGERRLFSTLGKPTDGLVSTLLNRPLSTRISRHLSKTRVTPTIWTLILFFVAIFGVWVLTAGNSAGFILGTFIFQIVSALDGCDGELARVRFQESKQGEWIDTLADLSGNIMFLFALGLGLSRQDGIDAFTGKLYFLEGLVTSLALLGTLWAVRNFTRKRESSGHFNNFGNSVIREMELTGWLKRFSHFVVKILKRDTYTLIFFFMAVSGKTAWILHLMGIGIIFHLAVLVRPIIFPPRGAVEQSGQQNQA